MITDPSTVWFENPRDGQRFRVLALPDAANPGRFVLECVYRPMTGETAVPPHFHPTSTETFEIMSGQAKFPVGEFTGTAGPGDRVVMPSGMIHVHPWCTGPGPLHVRQTGESVPADPEGLLASLQALTAIFGLASAGKVNRVGLPGLLQLAVLVRSTMLATYLARPPVAVQRIAFSLLGSLGRLLGYRTAYPAYGIIQAGGLEAPAGGGTPASGATPTRRRSGGILRAHRAAGQGRSFRGGSRLRPTRGPPTLGVTPSRSPHPPTPSAGSQDSAPETPAPGRGTRMLKVVAGITAVLSLALAMRQAVVFVVDYRARQHRVGELLATSALQLKAGEYPAAWAALNQALKVAPDDRRVRAAREDVAQAWLDHARTGSSVPTFTALADTLAPVLTEGLLRADSLHRADLVAHLGWADFLRWREGHRELSPPARYRESLALDPRNPFAHAMLGHWLLWQGDSVAAAREHFVQALAAGREHDYARRMQLYALANGRRAGATAEFIRVANEMRAGGEQPPEDARDPLWYAFSEVFGPAAPDRPRAELLASVPAGDLLATWRWLFEGTGYPATKGIHSTYQLAQLQEFAGDTAAALAGYRAVLAERGVSDALLRGAGRGLARLKQTR
jgi:hypothetical protein